MVRLVNKTASRAFSASSICDDNRVFWDFDHDTENLSFDEVSPMLVNWATRYVEVLASIEDAVFMLWYTIHTDTEFVGLALESAHLQALGSCKIGLMISAYTQPGDNPGK